MMDVEVLHQHHSQGKGLTSHHIAPSAWNLQGQVVRIRLIGSNSITASVSSLGLLI